MSLQTVDKPPLYDKLFERVKRQYEMKQAGNGLTGFDGYLSPGLGDDFLYNHPCAILQLVTALAIAPSKDVAKALDIEPPIMSDRLVKVLRDNQVLEGFRLIDLGCGLKPGLALAAKALGAEVHTVDSLPIPGQYASLLDSHTALDLCEPDGPSRLAEVTGRNVDFVTSNIIGTVINNDNVGLIKPSIDTLEQYGEQLLRPGGYAYIETGDLLQKR